MCVCVLTLFAFISKPVPNECGNVEVDTAVVLRGFVLLVFVLVIA